MRPSRYGTAMRSLEICGSTNDEARVWANNGAPDGAVVTALQQTKGRGRLGREWVSSGENLYFSVVSRPHLLPEQLPVLSLVVGLAVAEGVEPFVHTKPLVKWPNDVLLDHKKLSGVLLELSVVKDKCEFVIIGIGVNVNQQTFPPELTDIATSIFQQEQKNVPISEVLWSVLWSLESCLDAMSRGELPHLLSRWKSRSCTLGRRVRVTQPSETIEGEAFDIREDGALLLKDDAGVLRVIVAGDVVSVRSQ